MSQEQFQAFIAKVQGDSQLQAKLNAAASPDDVVKIAKDTGFSISCEELQKSLSQTELSENELESVAGGGPATVIGVTGWQGCGGPGPVGITGWYGCGHQ
jgi:predicted ribosomally synthesized peptide with nif11-like leader